MKFPNSLWQIFCCFFLAAQAHAMPVTQNLASGQANLASGFKPVQVKRSTTYALDSLEGLQNSNVLMESKEFDGHKALAVRMSPEAQVSYVPDGPVFAWIPVDFHDGSIEVDLVGSREPDAPPQARGFVGLGFRIQPDTKHFEGIYLRPTNGRADDQVRRNHSTQYFSYPTYDFAYFRKHHPEKYESYCDLQSDTWMHMRVEVQGEKARLYVNHMPQPVLIVDDLKLDNDARGGIGLWVDMGTQAYFKNLKVVHWD